MRHRRQVVVVGLGRFGSSIARTLSELGHEVLGLDKNLDIVNQAADYATHAVQVDGSSEESLKELGIQDFDMGVVCIGEDVKSSILITLLLKKLGVRWVVSKADDDLHGEILRRVGADRVVYPERETGVRVAHGLAVPAMVDYLKVMPGYGIFKLVAPPSMAGKTVGDLHLRGPVGLTAMLIARGTELILAPGRDETVRQGDVLIVAGQDDRADALGTVEAVAGAGR